MDQDPVIRDMTLIIPYDGIRLGMAVGFAPAKVCCGPPSRSVTSQSR